MPRWTETWLSGPGSVGLPSQDGQAWPGQRLGLPETGPGSLASTGSRVVAFLVDALTSGFIAALFIPDLYDSRRGVLGVAILAVETIALLVLTGQSFGMRLLGLRVAPVGSERALPSLLSASLRTALLILLLPALISDRDRRGLHDRAARAVVVRAR